MAQGRGQEDLTAELLHRRLGDVLHRLDRHRLAHVLALVDVAEAARADDFALGHVLGHQEDLLKKLVGALVLLIVHHAHHDPHLRRIQEHPLLQVLEVVLVLLPSHRGGQPHHHEVGAEECKAEGEVIEIEDLRLDDHRAEERDQDLILRRHHQHVGRAVLVGACLSVDNHREQRERAADTRAGRALAEEGHQADEGDTTDCVHDLPVPLRAVILREEEAEMRELGVGVALLMRLVRVMALRVELGALVVEHDEPADGQEHVQDDQDGVDPHERGVVGAVAVDRGVDA
mmetsp:Transcript_77103/g.221522  ORF Transcript_77103/g.221522 Transcript_77103/m.221522 type:complete len:288 (-) Transcript_77103:2284-3147(-)